jgi:hypothetical protein
MQALRRTTTQTKIKKRIEGPAEPSGKRANCAGMVKRRLKLAAALAESQQRSS